MINKTNTKIKTLKKKTIEPELVSTMNKCLYVTYMEVSWLHGYPWWRNCTL